MEAVGAPNGPASLAHRSSVGVATCFHEDMQRHEIMVCRLQACSLNPLHLKGCKNYWHVRGLGSRLGPLMF